MRLFVFALSAALACAAPAFAAFIHPADTNKDGKISQAEWTAFKSFDPAQFAKADTNHDGFVDGPEFMAWDAAGRGKAPAG